MVIGADRPVTANRQSSGVLGISERKSRIVRNSGGRSLKMVTWAGNKDRSSEGEVNMIVSQSTGRFPDELV